VSQDRMQDRKARPRREGKPRLAHPRRPPGDLLHRPLGSLPLLHRRHTAAQGHPPPLHAAAHLPVVGEGSPQGPPDGPAELQVRLGRRVGPAHPHVVYHVQDPGNSVGGLLGRVLGQGAVHGPREDRDPVLHLHRHRRRVHAAVVGQLPQHPTVAPAVRYTCRHAAPPFTGSTRGARCPEPPAGGGRRRGT